MDGSSKPAVNRVKQIFRRMSRDTVWLLITGTPYLAGVKIGLSNILIFWPTQWNWFFFESEILACPQAAELRSILHMQRDIQAQTCGVLPGPFWRG